MLVKKADDYQSWYIEEDGYGILIDPWLDNKLNSNKYSAFLQRNRESIHALSDDELKCVKSIIITAPYLDHLHIPSLRLLGDHLSIYSKTSVKRILRKKNIQNPFKSINDQNNIGPFKLTPHAAGFPYKASTFSFLLVNQKGKSIFYEGHMASIKEIKNENIKSDLAILTAESVKFLGFISLSMNKKNAIKILDQLGARYLMLTGTKPELTKGLVKYLLKFEEEKLEPSNKKVKILKNAGDFVIL